MKLAEGQTDKTKAFDESVAPFSGQYKSSVVNGYEVVFDYNVTYAPGIGGGVTSENTAIDFTLKLNRTSIDVLPVVSGIVNLKDVFNGIISNFMYWKTNEDGITMTKSGFIDVPFSVNFEYTGWS